MFLVILFIIFCMIVVSVAGGDSFFDLFKAFFVLAVVIFFIAALI